MLTSHRQQIAHTGAWTLAPQCDATVAYSIRTQLVTRLRADGTPSFGRHSVTKFSRTVYETFHCVQTVGAINTMCTVVLDKANHHYEVFSPPSTRQAHYFTNKVHCQQTHTSFIWRLLFLINGQWMTENVFIRWIWKCFRNLIIQKSLHKLYILWRSIMI